MNFRKFFAYISLFFMSTNFFAKKNLQEKASDFKFEMLNGKSLNLKDYEGKVIMIVNTASKCGFTGQYAELEELYKKFKDKNFIIIAVPSNDFANQEPGNDQEIQQFCKKNYGVTFPVSKKVSVKGDNAHPFYKYARKKLGYLSSPKWNFHKYLIDKNGVLVDYYYPTTSPMSKKVRKKISILLK